MSKENQTPESGNKFKKILENAKDKLLFYQHKPVSRVKSKQKELQLPSIVETYKSGDTRTRMQVLLVVALFAGFIYGSTQFVSLLLTHDIFSSGEKKVDEDHQRVAEYLKQKVKDRESKQSMVSLGKMKLNAPRRTGEKGFLQVNLFVVCDTPETASFVETNYPLLLDALSTKLVGLQYERLITTEGKENLKRRMLTIMNRALDKGEIREVYFQNIVLN